MICNIIAKLHKWNFLCTHAHILPFPICRQSCSGDRLSATPDNLSPSLANGGGGLLATSKGTPPSLSNIEVISVTNDTVSNSQHSVASSTLYHSSTLPLRRHRTKLPSEEKGKKVTCLSHSQQVVVVHCARASQQVVVVHGVWASQQVVVVHGVRASQQVVVVHGVWASQQVVVVHGV